VQDYGYNGAFSLAEPVAFRDFTDGASNTAAVTEWLTAPSGAITVDPRRSVFQTPVAFKAKGELNSFAASCYGLDPISAKPALAVNVGVPWTHGDFGHSLYNHVMPINERTCLNGNLHQLGAWTAKSNHSRGVQTLFADGHTHFLSESVSSAVWRALGSRNGGDVMSVSDSY
jgi:prepilin-type processing-associated H-X9-DG protein